jgi:hypothetical protein
MILSKIWQNDHPSQQSDLWQNARESKNAASFSFLAKSTIPTSGMRRDLPTLRNFSFVHSATLIAQPFCV